MNLLVLSNMDGVTVSLETDALSIKSKVLTSSRQIVSVVSEETQRECVQALQMVNTILRDVEDSRVKVKKPVLDRTRQIDDIAKAYCADIEPEKARLSKLLSGYQAEQIRIQREEEAKRKAEADRIEQERIKAEREAFQKAEAERRRIEAERIKAQKEAEEAAAKIKAAAKNEIAILQAEFDAQEEVKRLNRQAQERADHINADAKRAEEASQAARLQAMTAKPLEQPKKAAGMIVKTVWKFSVKDLNILHSYNASLVRMEENAQAINTLIRQGARVIPGLDIFEEVDANARAL